MGSPSRSTASALLCLCVAALVAPAGLSAEASASRSLLADVRAQFPQEPLVVEGVLRTYPTAARGVRRIPVQIDFALGAERPQVAYTIRDPKRAEATRFVVTRPHDAAPTYTVFDADQPRTSTKVDMTGAIAGSDVSWLDLSMAYLWWSHEEIVGRDSIKGYDCTVVHVTPGDVEAGAYASARLWIADDVPVLLRAEGYDADGKMLRRLSVRSFKKIDGRWVIKDLDVAAGGTASRSRIQVKDVRRPETGDRP